MNKSESWHSNWNGGKRKKVVDYPAAPGTIHIIDADTVKTTKEPLLRESNGKWGQLGLRYLRDHKDEIYGVVLSSNNEGDIVDVLKHKKWQHSSSAKEIKPGMLVFVVPSKKVIKDNPTAVGVRFTVKG